MLRSVVLTAAFAASAGAALAAPVLNAATLPNSRAVAVNSPATLFASVINSGDTNATNCRVALGFGADPSLSVSYAPADGAGSINGPADTPVTINLGTTQQFVVAVTASSAFTGSVPLTYVCDNGQAISATGLNDLSLHATVAAGPDVITIASTLTGDGIMNTNANGRAIISIAALNIGAGDPPPDGGPDVPMANEATITVRPTYTNFTDGAQHTLTICQSNASAVCQTAFASSVQASIGDSPVFFNVALQQLADIGVPFFPGEYRLRVEFLDSGGNLVGATSVAPRSGSPVVQEDLPHGLWEMFVRDDSDPGGSFTRTGRLFFPPDGGPGMGAVQRNDGANAYIQPILLSGDYDNARFVGCAQFLETGQNDLAYPGLTMPYEPRHFMRGNYDSASGNACPPQAGDIATPSMNPVSSSGWFYFAYVGLADDGGPSEDPPVINWMIRNPLDENDSYGTATMVSDQQGGYSVTGTYRDCALTGSASRFSPVSSTFGSQLAFRVSYTLSTCPQGAPAWATGDFTGFFAINAMEDGSSDVEAFQTIFTDGFESGDVSAWSATVP
jgi:hypothetical protein